MEDLYHIAVLDVGKTNKKLLVYDPQLAICHTSKRKIAEITEDGINHDDLDKILSWYQDQLKAVSKRFNIKSIAVSTHGATFVGIDEKGTRVFPQVSYTYEPGEGFHQEFYETFGDPIYLQKATGTPNFGALINNAKGIYFIKKMYPEAFEKAAHILNYAQYFGFWLTGNLGADWTSIGCHQYLWDFQNHNYSSVAERMGIKGKLVPDIGNPYDTLGTIRPQLAEKLGLSKDVKVAYGIHDSNSALLPYLISSKKDFILNSTGTWCVVMHKEDQVKFAEAELGKTVFFNIGAFGDPIKTSIFMGGLEFETYEKLIKDIHGDLPLPEFNIELYQSIINGQDQFILPSVVKGTGQFPDNVSRIVEGGTSYGLEQIGTGEAMPQMMGNYELSFAVLNISLAIQTKVALDRAGMKTGLPLFIEGGFRNNMAYCKLLSALYPGSGVSLTNLEEASAYGAAICGKAILENKDPMDMSGDIKIEKTEVEAVQLEGFAQYITKYLGLLE